MLRVKLSQELNVDKLAIISKQHRTSVSQAFLTNKEAIQRLYRLLPRKNDGRVCDLLPEIKFGKDWESAWQRWDGTCKTFSSICDCVALVGVGGESLQGMNLQFYQPKITTLRRKHNSEGSKRSSTSLDSVLGSMQGLF